MTWHYDPKWRYFVKDNRDGTQTFLMRESVEAYLEWTHMTLEEMARALMSPTPGAYH